MTDHARSKEPRRSEKEVSPAISGIVNAYAAVTAIQGDTITLAGAGHPFQSNDRVLVIQMAGASIDTSNTEKFGTITDDHGAGRYLWATVAGVAGQKVKLLCSGLDGFDTKSGHVQLVRASSHPGDVVVSGPVSAAPWDGSVGGVIVIEAAGTLELAADVDASGVGFKGGLAATGSGAPTAAYADPDTVQKGHKGAGIAAVDSSQICGRGAPANGGGGGGGLDSGGGGGGNGGAGGHGGNDYGGKETGGLGGCALDFADRAFMGGGGGGGQQNNKVGSAGAGGGGIVVLRAQTIAGAKGNGVRANGGDALAAKNDGGGGGGAGGTILIDAAAVSGVLSLEAKGGNGGNCNAAHGPGAGGGGGTIRTREALPGAVTTSVAPGSAGRAKTDARNAVDGAAGIVGPLGFVGDRQLEAMTTKIADLEAQLVKCGDCEQKLAEASGKLAERDKSLAETSGKLVERDKQLAEASAKLTEANSKLAERDTSLAEVKSDLSAPEALDGGPVAAADADIAALARQGEKIVNEHTAYAAAAAFIPLPGVDLAAVTLLQIRMLAELTKIYGHQRHWSDGLGKRLIGIVVADAAGGAVTGSITKLILPFGAAAFVAGPAAAGAVTAALGRVFHAHYASGGTLLDFDAERARRRFQQALRDGSSGSSP